MRVSFIGVLAGLAFFAAPVAHAQLLTSFEEFNAGTEVILQEPGFSGSTSANVSVARANSSAVSEEMAFSGAKSLKVDFDWTDNAPTRWARLTTNNTPNLPNPTIDFTTTLSMRLYIASADPLGVALGVRETNATADIGANGGAAGGIEFLGMAAGLPSRVLAPGVWHDLVFDLPNETVTAFAGATANGILESTTGKGVLEHLRIQNAGQGTAVTFYLDDIRVGPGGDAIPEPGSMALLASGLLPLLAFRRRNR